jgi:hypothetical protein
MEKKEVRAQKRARFSSVSEPREGETLESKGSITKGRFIMKARKSLDFV